MRATGEKPDPVGPSGMAGERSDDPEKVDRLKVSPGLAGTGEKPPAFSLGRCTYCDATLGETVWSGALPWWFCSRECARAYHEKDGPLPNGSTGTEGT